MLRMQARNVQRSVTPFHDVVTGAAMHMGIDKAGQQ
jgi:hypothetical protein